MSMSLLDSLLLKIQEKISSYIYIYQPPIDVQAKPITIPLGSLPHFHFNNDTTQFMTWRKWQSAIHDI